MKKLKLLILLQTVILVLALVGGCATSTSADSYPSRMARTSFEVVFGEVVSTRPVEIEGEATVLGRLGGAWIGYAIGRGDADWYSGANRIESAVGGVTGTVVGETIERSARTHEGLEVIVRLDHGQTLAVVQDLDLVFEPGQRVQILRGPDGSARVQPAEVTANDRGE